MKQRTYSIVLASGFTHNPIFVFEWFLGIFLVIVILYRTPLIKMK